MGFPTRLAIAPALRAPNPSSPSSPFRCPRSGPPGPGLKAPVPPGPGASGWYWGAGRAPTLRGSRFPWPGAGHQAQSSLRSPGAEGSLCGRASRTGCAGHHPLPPGAWAHEPRLPPATPRELLPGTRLPSSNKARPAPLRDSRAPAPPGSARGSQRGPGPGPAPQRLPSPAHAVP